jgi:ABC-type transporter Mla subunit MlaD
MAHEREMLQALKDLARHNKHQHRELMERLQILIDALNRDTDAIGDLSTAIQQLIAQGGGTGGITDAQLQAVADTLDRNTQSLADLAATVRAALENPPTPTPAGQIRRSTSGLGGLR